MKSFINKERVNIKFNNSIRKVVMRGVKLRIQAYNELVKQYSYLVWKKEDCFVWKLIVNIQGFNASQWR